MSAVFSGYLISWSLAGVLSLAQKTGFSTNVLQMTFVKLHVTKNCIAWLAWLSRGFARVHNLFILGSYVSVKSKLQHAPPGQPPGHLTFLKIIVQIPPYRSQNTVQMPHTRSIQVIKCPHPGDISQAHTNDTRTAETPSAVKQNLYL